MKTNRPAFRRGFLILASMALATSPVFAQTQAPANATTAAVISSVAITQAPERSAVRVEGEGRLDVHAARMQSPDRLVLDFAGAKLAVQKTAIPGTSAPVRGVRMAQYRPDVARVVIDLTAATRYQVERDGEAVIIYLDSPSKTVATTNAVLRSSKDSSASSPRFALPSELTQPSATLASFSEKNEADATPQQAAQQAVQQATTAASTMAASAAGQAPAEAPTAAPAGKYTGEPISVNLKDVDLKDFFRLIHEISGLNVVLDPAVKGTLTIVLDEVPWDQALDIVMQNNGLDKQLNGNVLRIATRSTLKSEAETARDLQKAQAEAIAPVTVTRILSYAKAATLAPVLKKFLSSRGDILFDDRSNQIIVRDIPSVIPIIDNLMHQLDRKAQQVEIEARVVSASRSFSLDIGTQLGLAGQTTSGRSFAGGDSDVGTSPVSNTSPPAVLQTAGTTSLPLNTNFPAVAPTSGLSLIHRSPNFSVDFFITAAEAKGVGKLLSKPKITTQNNEKATVKQGTKIPIQTTINNTISVQFIDAVLKLEVTPQITAEGTVYMDVLVENTQIDTGIPRVSGIPALDTESAETKVTVADGGTVVIGGIIISSQRTDIQQVPLVGSLPLIGNLFKRTSVSTSQQELMFFLTPRIIPG